MIIAVSILTTGAIVTSCNSSAENVKIKRKEVKEAKSELEEAKQKYYADVEQYKKDKADNISTNEKIIADFRKQIESEKADAKQDYEKRVAELELKNEQMKEKMTNYKPIGEENWNNFKREFNHDMDELGKAFKDLTVNNRK